jgi:hypothetical protein
MVPERRLMDQAATIEIATPATSTETVTQATIAEATATAAKTVVSLTVPVMRLSHGLEMKKRNAEEEWTKCATANTIETITAMADHRLPIIHQEALIADLRTLTDHHLAETMNGRTANW